MSTTIDPLNKFLLDTDIWVSMFQPLDNISGKQCGITVNGKTRLLLDPMDEADQNSLSSAHPSTVWTVVNGDTRGAYIVSGSHQENQRQCIITRIGIEDNDVKVPLGIDNTTVDIGYEMPTNENQSRTCEHGCFATSKVPTMVYVSQGKFSHFYCGYCGNTC